MPSHEREFLPIRVFAQREMDEQRVEPGGGSDKPSWVLTGSDLESRASVLRQGLIDSLNNDKHNPSLAYVFEVKLDERDTAKSKRKAIVDMLSLSGSQASSVTGMKGATSLVLELPDNDAVNTVADRLVDLERYDEPISCVTGIEVFKPAVEFREEGTYKLKLQQNASWNESTLQLFEKALQAEGIDAKRTRYSRKSIIYKAELSSEMAHAILDSTYGELIFSIRPMPKLNVVLDGLDSRAEIATKNPDEYDGNPILGILDSGVGEIDQLAPWVDTSTSPYPQEDMDRAHGTFVAGIALYGDELEGHPWIEGLPPKVVDSCILPDPNRLECNEDELVENIREAVAARSNEVKVWNLSVSINSPISNEEFSDFAQTLDEIQDEFGVLFCKSAGNCTAFLSGMEKLPLSAGADSVRALTVGSATHAKGKWDATEIGEASPFSRIGPGPQFIIKPEVSHFGGNAGRDPFGEAVSNGVASFDLSGRTSTSCGTSFSTPRVSSLAANLAYSLDGDFDPLLVKAMIVHSASFPAESLIPPDEKVREMGFGIPASVPEILTDEPYEATVILRDTLRKGEIIDILDFPVPQSLAENGHFRGQIIVTLVTAPILDPSQGGEYCQSDLDIKLGTYDDLKDRDTTKQTILNPIGRSNSANLLLASSYSKKSLKKTDGDFSQRERMLIEYGNKYYPVKKYAIDLADLTNANKAKVVEGRHWYLKLKGTFRDAIERKALLEGTIPEQEFCMIATIRDPKKIAPVYNDVAVFLDTYGFLHSTVAINNVVSARIR